MNDRDVQKLRDDLEVVLADEQTGGLLVIALQPQTAKIMMVGEVQTNRVRRALYGAISMTYGLDDKAAAELAKNAPESTDDFHITVTPSQDPLPESPLG